MASESTAARVTKRGTADSLAPEGSYDVASLARSADALTRVAVDGRGAARAHGVSFSFWKKLDSSGRVPRAVRLGRRKVWPVRELEEWLAAGAPARERWEQLKRGAR